MIATDFHNQQTFSGTLQRDLHSSNILDNLMALSAAAELVGAEIIPLSEFRLCMPIKQFQQTKDKLSQQNSAVHSKDNNRQVTMNSGPFLVLNSNTEQHKNSFSVLTTTDWNHPSHNQVKAPTLEDLHYPPLASITKVSPCNV